MTMHTAMKSYETCDYELERANNKQRQAQLSGNTRLQWGRLHPKIKKIR